MLRKKRRKKKLRQLGYIKKAATEIGTSAMKGDYKKMQKRHKGVLDASDKLAKEEVIPEAKYELVHQLMVKHLSETKEDSVQR